MSPPSPVNENNSNNNNSTTTSKSTNVSSLEIPSSSSSSVHSSTISYLNTNDNENNDDFGLLSPTVQRSIQQAYSENDTVGGMFKPVLVPIFWAIVLAIPLRRLKRGFLQYLNPVAEEEDKFYRHLALKHMAEEAEKEENKNQKEKNEQQNENEPQKYQSGGRKRKKSSTHFSSSSSSSFHQQNSLYRSRSKRWQMTDSISLKRMKDPPRTPLSISQHLQLAMLKIKAIFRIILKPLGGSSLPVIAILAPLIASSTYLALNFSGLWFLVPASLFVFVLGMICFTSKYNYHSVAAVLIVSCLLFGIAVFFFFFLTKCIQEIVAFFSLLSAQFEQLRDNPDFQQWLRDHDLTVENVQDRLIEVQDYVLDFVQENTALGHLNITEIAAAFQTPSNGANATASTANVTNSINPSTVLSQIQSSNYDFTSLSDYVGYLNTLNPLGLFKSVGTASYGIFSLIISLSVGMFDIVAFFLIFLSCVFYLLQWERSLVSQMVKIIPVDKEMKDSIETHLHDSVTGVFICTFAVCLINACTTWITFAIAKVPFLYITTLASGFFALFPMIAPWILSLPAVIYLWFHGQYLYICIVAGAQLILFMSVDSIYTLISKDWKPHKYIVGLSIALGMYQFNFMGVLIGPLLVCITLTAFNVFASYTKSLETFN